MTATIDNVIDSIISPQTTGQTVPQEVMDAQAVLGYSGGNSWPTFTPYEKARPVLAAKHWVIPVTLSCVAFGHIYDIEDHGGKNENIGVFMHNAVHVWKTPLTWGLPWLYTFASNVEAMAAAAKGFGYEHGKDYYILSSHATQKKHICGPHTCGEVSFDCDGGQYFFGGHFDRSVLNAYMLDRPAPPKPNPYAIFPTDVGDHTLPNKGNERLTAEQVDGALEHPVKYKHYLQGTLYGELKQYRDRAKRVSLYAPPDFTSRRHTPNWSDHRGARWHGLNNRMKKIEAL